MDEFLRPLEQTAHLCGMEWETPFVVHGAPLKDEAGLKMKAEFYAKRLASLVQPSKARA
jgi:glutathione-regulated potassium-efflux system ancillary protein KefG